MKYYRRTDQNKPMSDWGHAMFTTDPGRIESYGKHLWSFDTGTPIGDLAETIIDRWNLDRANGFPGAFGNLDEEMVNYWMEFDGEAVYYELDPEDIVTSAAGWDSELVVWVWDRVLENNDILIVILNNGAVVFDESAIKKEDRQ